MKTTDLLQGLERGRFDAALAAVYGADVPRQKARIREAVGEFEALYGAGRDVMVCSAPGRTEICGNHTDHNHGKVLAAAVNLDALAIVARNEDGIAQVKSKGYRMDQVSLEELEPSEAENGKAIAMLRGMLARLKALGYIVGGFSAYTTSDVLSGSGLSSSAAYEVLLGTVISHLFNGGEIDPVVIAQAAQYAENVFFGKPSGLLDQMTASVGGFVTIDFADPASPVIAQVDYDFAASGHTLCIVDTGGSHADLTDEYAAVRSEMEAVARALGQDVLRRVDPGAFRAQIAALRDKVGDRAVLRAMHFFQENDRVDAAAAALRAGDFGAFKEQVAASGRSSYMYNQNVFAPRQIHQQGVSLALARSEELLGHEGVCRVHGGGFAGTVQAFVPDAMLEEYRQEMEAVFGSGSCYVLSVRPVGGVKFMI